MYLVSFILAEKTQRKQYKTEKGALRAIAAWLNKHAQNPTRMVSLYGPELTPQTYTDASELTIVATALVDFYRSQSWLALRARAFEQYGHQCACCGSSPKTGAVMHVDHIKPRSNYPELALDINNLQILCAQCNLGKSNRSEKQWH